MISMLRCYCLISAFDSPWGKEGSSKPSGKLLRNTGIGSSGAVVLDVSNLLRQRV